MDKINSDQLFIQLPLILAKSFPDLLAILTVATDLTEEQISSDEFGLKDGVNVVIAILDTNDYREIFEEIKKAWTRLKTAPVEPVSK